MKYSFKLLWIYRADHIWYIANLKSWRLIGTFDTTLGKHIWESIVAEARIALHIRVLEGRNAHHVFEAQFKAVARALRDAVSLDGRVSGIPSTKGTL
jgi:imidazoleglycerol-phosphate dehydratase